MKKLDHPNIVRLFEVVDDIDGDKLFMFMEYVALGPVVRRNPKTNCFTSSATGHICEEAAAGRYLLDITSGIRYLHLHNIAHRDLKPDNVLLGGNGICKIADFGVAHHFEEDLAKQKPVSMQSLERSHSRAQIRETQGTYCFWAPEMLEEDKKFNAYACDMWAMGVCYYIFVTGKLPFYAVVPIELFNLIAQASPALPGNLNEHSKRIINGLLCVDVKKRLTVQDLESDLWLLKSAQSPKRQARLDAFSPVKQKVSVLFHGAKKSLLTAFAHLHIHTTPHASGDS